MASQYVHSSGMDDAYCFINSGIEGKVMYSSGIVGGRSGKVIYGAALSLFFIFSGSYGTTVMAADAITTKYPMASAFSSANTRFDLLATDDGTGDDCDTPFSIADGNHIEANGQDTILLAKLDVNKKQRGQSTATSASTVPVAKEVFPPIATAPAVAPADQVWEIVMSDKTLNGALARWAASVGWQLMWELPVDYAVEAKTSVHGSFEEAVNTIAQSMTTAEIPMKAVFYQGNKVLRIMAKGSE